MLEGNDRILSQSKSILKEYDLCDFCLGRFFINLSSFSSARRLGLKIRNWLIACLLSLSKLHFLCKKTQS